MEGGLRVEKDNEMSGLGTAQSTRRRVLALVAQNENQALAYASEGMGGFFAPFGYQTQVIDLLSPQGLQHLSDALLSGEVAFAFGFAGVGSQLLAQDNRSIWTAFRIPFVSFWYDHPSYNYRQHIAASPYILNCYHILDHLQVWQNYLPHHNSAIHLPPPAGPNPLARSVPWAQRERRFMFAKTTYDLKQIVAGWKDYSAPLQQMLWRLIEAAQQDRHLDLSAATAVLFAKIGESITHLDNFMGVVQTVDHYIRAWRGEQMARALCAQHYPADIFGNGWTNLAQELAGQQAGRQGGRVEFLPSFSSQELWPRISRYRLVANVNPLWREGIHERVMNGIASGAVTVTDNSERGDSVLGDLPHYVGFEWTDDRLPHALALAWDKAQDDMDYVDAGTKRVESLVYTAENFMRPLERALQAMCDRAQAA